MTRAVTPQTLTLVAALFTACAVGCRPAEPPDRYDRDLGTDGSLLLPTASVLTVAKIADGDSDWVDFRDPTAPPPTAAPARTTSGPAALETEIRELLEEYNRVATDAEATVAPVF